MKPTINMITIPVRNLEESEAFYRKLLEIPEEKISAGDDHIAFFLEQDISLVLFERKGFAEMTGQANQTFDHSTLILTHTATSEQEVDKVLLEAEEAGGSIYKQGTSDEWSYTGYFNDPNGHVWEVIAWK
ncbi:VOC family protein [Gracilibacillus salinarum]|uniref:VOC family protein n=1 Tax=Gracilibacillus salinarum TaxID=2932255 RepID=A0ABY4GJM1_9BACI|nr:VOC family protein [Gracilibacillus salinarum]UOQ84394.1 VOC family protein [Gracilibacillus salinarum]